MNCGHVSRGDDPAQASDIHGTEFTAAHRFFPPVRNINPKNRDRIAADPCRAAPASTAAEASSKTAKTARTATRAILQAGDPLTELQSFRVGGVEKLLLQILRALALGRFDVETSDGG